MITIPDRKTLRRKLLGKTRLENDFIVTIIPDEEEDYSHIFLIVK